MADQTRLRPDMTPADVRRPPARRGRSEGLTARAQVEMENGDVIDVYQEQMGGGDGDAHEVKAKNLNYVCEGEKVAYGFMVKFRN